MSAKGLVGPLHLTGQHAALVGALIQTRVAPYAPRLEGTPLAALPEFGRKLQAAARRKRKSHGSAKLWNIQRIEAQAAFHYLSLFFRPDTEGLLNDEETGAAREIVLAVASALGARPGKKRMTREDADRRVLAWQQPAEMEEDLQVDKRWKQRLQRRGERQDALGRRHLKPIPQFLLHLMAPLRISR